MLTLLVRWNRVRDDRLLLALGAVIGVGAQTKFQIIALGLVLLACVALAGPRALLRRPRLWIGAGIAVLIAAPTLAWQAANGWPHLALAPVIAAQAHTLHGGRGQVALDLLTNAGVLGMALGAVGLLALLADRARRDHRLGVAFLVLYAAFAIPPGRPNYLAGFYGVLAAAGAVALQRHRKAARPWWEWVAWPLAALSVVLAGHTLAQSVPKASPTTADAVVESTAQTYRALPSQERERTAVMGDTFMYAAYLDTAPRAVGLPPAISGHVSYGYFPLPSESRDSILLVGHDAIARLFVQSFRPFFAEVRLVASVTPPPAHRQARSSGTTSVWLLTGKRLSWPQLWPALKTFG